MSLLPHFGMYCTGRPLLDARPYTDARERKIAIKTETGRTNRAGLCGPHTSVLGLSSVLPRDRRRLRSMLSKALNQSIALDRSQVCSVRLDGVRREFYSAVRVESSPPATKMARQRLTGKDATASENSAPQAPVPRPSSRRPHPNRSPAVFFDSHPLSECLAVMRLKKRSSVQTVFKLRT